MERYTSPHNSQKDGPAKFLRISALNLIAPGGDSGVNEGMNLLLAILLVQAPVEKPLDPVKDAPVVVPFAPGLEVRELPVTLSNLTNLEYAPDGRLFAAGY